MARGSRWTNQNPLYFKFYMVHIPGRFHKGPDAMSRVLRMEILRQMWQTDHTKDEADDVLKVAKICIPERNKTRGL